MTKPQKDEIKPITKSETPTNKKLNTELSEKLSKLNGNIKTNGLEWKVFSRLVASNFSLKQAACLKGTTKYPDKFDKNIFCFLKSLIQTNAFLDDDIRTHFSDWYSDYNLHNSYYRLATLHSEGRYSIEINKKVEKSELDIDFTKEDPNVIFNKLHQYSTVLYDAFFTESTDKTEGNAKDAADKPSMDTTSKSTEKDDGNKKDTSDKQSIDIFESTNRRNKWVVHARNKNQKLFCKLYGKMNLVKEHGYKWKIFSALIASSFSLWRAAPLCDNQRDTDDFIKSTHALLSIITNNNNKTIGTSFRQDINNEEWVVGYYLRNSYYRLVEISKGKKHSDILNYDYFYELLRYEPQKCWDKLHKYSMELFEDTFV